MNTVKRIEAILIDAIAAVTPWLAPLIPAYLVYKNMTQQLGYPVIFGLIGASAVEFLGLSAVHTAVTFWQWNDNHKSERAPFWFAFAAGLFYVVIVLTVNAALDIWRDSDGVKIFAHALLSLLSVDAAIIIAIRAQHARRLTERDIARQERKAERQAATMARHDATSATGDAPVTRQPATREEFVTSWRDNGHTSVASLAELLNVNPRTAQRWISQDEKKA